MRQLSKPKLITATLASIYFLYYCYSFKVWHFIDNVNLIIHEAGHTLFALFGSFVGLLGGSFLQIFFPLIFVFYFFQREQYFSASLLLFWVGQNFINVSVYTFDAVDMQLPLLGGDSSIHDWNSILQTLGLLEHTQLIGSLIYATGFIIIISAIGFSFRNSTASFQE